VIYVIVCPFDVSFDEEVSALGPDFSRILIIASPHPKFCLNPKLVLTYLNSGSYIDSRIILITSCANLFEKSGKPKGLSSGFPGFGIQILWNPDSAGSRPDKFVIFYGIADLFY
jgi:hypothetical protein